MGEYEHIIEIFKGRASSITLKDFAMRHYSAGFADGESSWIGKPRVAQHVIVQKDRTPLDIICNWFKTYGGECTVRSTKKGLHKLVVSGVDDLAMAIRLWGLYSNHPSKIAQIKRCINEIMRPRIRTDIRLRRARSILKSPVADRRQFKRLKKAKRLYLA